MSVSHDLSIVEYYAENEGYRCGYCKSPNTNYSHGMWAHGLTVQDYQDLIDRGWRRSGSYCYKPTMNLTCCPMYTIKCSVLDFKLSKSQKKKIKKINHFIAQGQKKSSVSDDSSSGMESGDDTAEDCSGINEFPGFKEKSERAQSNVGNAVVNSLEASFKDSLTAVKYEKNIEVASSTVAGASSSGVESLLSEAGASASVTVPDSSEANEKEDKVVPTGGIKKTIRPGEGMDPNRPQCKKAKLLRQERKEKKLAQLDTSFSAKRTKTPPIAKSLEDFLNEPLPDSPAHRLEIRLVRSSPKSKEFKSTFKASLEVYQRYQTTIHNDPIEKVSERQFTRFLVNSPLKPSKPSNGPPQGYGSFHQQYWLDGQLIAVGVVDILPYCVSSVYFFYDPEYQFLVLGTYGSLREIAFCRSLHHFAPNLRYYYMGFYIHSCQKMRYKGSFTPSFLLCPEVYSWHPIEYCIPLLERNKYCRFNEDLQAKDPDEVTSLNNVTVLFQNEAMYYRRYLSLNLRETYQQHVTQYAGLVGDKLSKRMLLILS